MNPVNDNQIMRELKTEAAKWIMKTFPDRMGGVGVDEIEVRNQLNTEADHWVQYNFDQRRQGKEGTPSPDFYLEAEGKPENVPNEWTKGTDFPPMSGDDC